MKHDISERYAFIESALLWEGRVTAKAVAEAFALTRQAAQKVIGDYRNRHPENLIRSTSQRCQVPTDRFAPRYVRPDPYLYLDFLRGQALKAHYCEIQDWEGRIPFCDVQRYSKAQLLGEAIRVVLAGIRTRTSIFLYYKSLNRTESRCFSPNRLVFASGRYHVRGYCSLAEKYIDLVLSRITYAEPSDEPWHPPEGDAEWSRRVRLTFQPNPELPQETLDALNLDYSLDRNGCHVVICPAAMAIYVRRGMASKHSDTGLRRWIEISQEPL